VAHVALARPVAALAQALRVLAAELLDRHRLLDAALGRAVEAHVQRVRLVLEDDRRRATEDHGAVARVLADQLLRLAPIVLAGVVAGLDHGSGQLGQQRERGHEAADRVPERLVVRERLVDRHRQPVGDARGDRAVEELDPETIGHGGPDLAPACAIGRGDGDERRRRAQIIPAR
jgi:hypothetical protein